MQSQKEKVATRRKSQEPASISTEHTSMNHIAANLGPVRSEYSDVLSALEIKEEYEPIVLCDYEPEDRRRRSEWLQGLCLPFSLTLLRRAYGGNIGTMNFLWKIPLDKNRRDDSIEMRLVLELNKNIPNFHSRQMEKDFIQRYARIAKTPISVLRNIYKEISGDCSEYNTQDEKDTSLRIATFISQCDNTDILIDLRKLYGKQNNSLYDEFWEEIHILFNEYQAAVQERRHSDVLYLPFAISIRELVERVVKRRPGIDVPSLEWVRLQFTPTNPYTNSALKYTSRFEIKFMVQRRQMRSDHPDSKYAYITFKYLKEFAIRYKDVARRTCLDDKAVIPVGNPGLPVSTNVRKHNRSLGPCNGPILGAADHDWNVAGIVSSVALCAEIPERISDSFFTGKSQSQVKIEYFKHQLQ